MISEFVSGGVFMYRYVEQFIFGEQKINNESNIFFQT